MFLILILLNLLIYKLETESVYLQYFSYSLEGNFSTFKKIFHCKPNLIFLLVAS